MKKPPAINREDFISRLMDDGLTFTQATRAYNSFMRTLDDAVVMGARINFWRIGSLKPELQEPRTVHMGFQRKRKGKDISQGTHTVKSKRVYELGRRLRYKFVLHKTFLNKRQLNWF